MIEAQLQRAASSEIVNTISQLGEDRGIIDRIQTAYNNNRGNSLVTRADACMIILAECLSAILTLPLVYYDAAFNTRVISGALSRLFEERVMSPGESLPVGLGSKMSTALRAALRGVGGEFVFNLWDTLMAV